jgi:tetratricopeptide (TPR) repeat protein
MSVARRCQWIFVGALLAACFVAEPALAQKYNFNSRNQKKAQKAVEAMQAGDPALAEEILLSVNLKRATPYGRARINQWLGTIATQKDDPDYEKALEYMSASISEEALQPEENLKTLYLVGQLQAMLQRYDEAVVTLEKWISSVESPSPSSYYTLAVTYYQAEQTENALEPARKAVELAEEPREAWYRLLLSLYLERNDYAEALAVLDDVILAYPSKAYWQQMAAIYAELDQMNKSLAVQQIAKSEGFLVGGKDLTRLAQMLMVEGLPHHGAKVMREGLDSGAIEPTEQAYDTYSNTLLQSREWAKALEPLTKAAELKGDGSLFVRVAQVNLQLGRWEGARSALNRAFDKGGVPDEGQAHILFGIASANDKKWSAAISAFKRAGKYPGTKEVAGKWIDYVEREKIRLGGG